MAWMKAIIESLLSPRQTFYCELAAANLSFETCPQNVVATVKRKVLRGSLSRKLGE